MEIESYFRSSRFDEETQPGETRNDESQIEKNYHFLRAVITNNEKKVLESIRTGIDIDFVFSGGETALSYAVSRSDGKIVEALIKAGANVNTTDDDGKTPLFCCANRSKRRFRRRYHSADTDDSEASELASTLIKAGADVNITDDQGKTVLTYALQSKNARLAQELINSGADVTDVKTIDEDGRTMLFYPSICENTSVLQKLMKSVDINSTDHWGKTALMVAVEQNQVRAVAELIKAGADVNLRDKKGKTALMHSFEIQKYEHEMSYRDVLQHTPVSPEVTGLFSHSKDQILSMLINAGADINRRDNLGKTSLIYCVQKGNPSQSFYSGRSSYIRNVYSNPEFAIDFSGLASNLIKSGADVNITDNEDRSALIYALQDGNENLARTLLKAGADAKITDKEGKTPLIYYAQHQVKSRPFLSRYHDDDDYPVSDTTDQKSLASMLIEACADINKTDDEGKSALMYSLQDGNESLAFALIKAGADVNTMDKEGKTVLIYYAENQKESLHVQQIYTSSSSSSLGIDTVDHSKLTSILIKGCADMNQTDNKGKTALIYSIQEGNDSLACALIEAGADVNVVDEDGRTALFYAAIYYIIKPAEMTTEVRPYLKIKQKLEEAATTKGCVILKLLDAGANANLTDKEGISVLMYYAEAKFIDVIHIEKEGMFKSVAAHLENEYNQLASALIKASQDVNIVDNQGKTTLTYFLQNSKDSCAIELINAGADVNITDVAGKTALFYIPADCDKIAIDKIIKSSTSINITDNQGKTALMYSLQENNESLACALIEAGADAKIVDNTERNALFYAIRKGQKDVFFKLVNSTDINVVDNQGKTVLMYAVQQVKGSFVEKLIDSGAEVNVADKDGKTALIYCAQQQIRRRDQIIRPFMSRYHPKWDLKRSETTDFNTIVSVLLKAGADVNITDNKGRNALMYSIKEDNESLAHALIDAGADVSIVDEDGKTALLYAVIHNRKSELVQDLIDAGADVNLCDLEGKTALICCAQMSIRSRGQMAYRCRERYRDMTGNIVASMLILFKACADVNKTDNKGRTALIYSLLHGYEDLALILIKADADVNIVDHDGHTALYYALISEKERVFPKLMGPHYEIISDSEAKTNPSSNAQDSLVVQLINAGADVNLTYDKKETALIFYARSGNKILVSTLIEAGADVNAADHKGKTALIHCFGDNNKTSLLSKFCEKNDFRSIAFDLMEAGADVNVADNEGKTALIYCCQDNNEDMVSRLIKAGADADITDNDGISAIFYGVGNDKIVNLLIKSGKANVFKRDHYGRSPLYYAMKKSLTSASLLLDNGSGLKRKDRYGISILSFFIEHCLRVKGQLSEGLDLLVKKGTHQDTIFEALVNSLFCKILFIASMPQSRKQHRLLSQRQGLKVFLQVINVTMKYVPEGDCQKFEIIQKLISEAKSLCTTVPQILELMAELDVNPSYADIDGNTALHYAACLPLAGASQDTVMKICHQLDELGASAQAKNHQNETPLLFCLSQKDWVSKGKENTKLIKILVKVCSFLLKQGATLEAVTQTEKSVFHLVMEIFDQGFGLHDDLIRKDILKETLALLHLFSSSLVTKGVTINKRDGELNSPLHAWARLNFNFPTSNEDSSAGDPYVFEKQILAAIFKHFRDCGAKLNDVNGMDQTPLHLCKTWTATKLLIDAGAKTNILDSEGSPPLLVTVKRNQIIIINSDASCIYPDLFQRPNEFWKTVVENKLDPWTTNNHGASVMSTLVKCEAFVLAKALLDVACDRKQIQTDTIAVSLLNAICKDQSRHAQWKSILVGQILKSRKNNIHQNDGEDTPLHYCCSNIAEEILLLRQRGLYDLQPVDDSLMNEMKTSVHWTIVKQLLSHGFNPSTLGTSHQSCNDIAKKCPALKELLTKPLNIDEVPLVIPWKSISKTYKPALAKVARRQECRQVTSSSFWYNQDNIQKGSFGLVFVGINEKDGREVAIKRMEKLRMHRPEDKREIKSLTALADCEQVVRYLFFDEDQDFSYVVLELMEGNLTDYLGSDPFLNTKKSITLCADVVKGLKYLHDQGYIHRDLKPSNILYKTLPRLCLKIADFGLSRCIDKGSTSATVLGSVAGTRCWIAPEVLKSSYKEHSMPSDVFSCGLLLHYILIIKRHPFSPVDCADKSEVQIHSETEANMLRDNREGWEPSLFPEGADLIKCMLDKDKKMRPSAAEALVHPMFWPRKKKMDFLTTVGNQPEIECPRVKRSSPLTLVEDDLEKTFGTIITEKTWDDAGYVNMPTIYVEMAGRRKYDTTSIVELVRFIRNTHAHVSEDKRPTSIKKLVLEDFVFLEYFPNLVMEVFNCIKTHGWDVSREEIKYALDDEMTDELKGCAESAPEETLTDVEND